MRWVSNVINCCGTHSFEWAPGLYLILRALWDRSDKSLPISTPLRKKNSKKIYAPPMIRNDYTSVNGLINLWLEELPKRLKVSHAGKKSRYFHAVNLGHTSERSPFHLSHLCVILTQSNIYYYCPQLLTPVCDSVQRRTVHTSGQTSPRGRHTPFRQIHPHWADTITGQLPCQGIVMPRSH